MPPPFRRPSPNSRLLNEEHPVNVNIEGSCAPRFKKVRAAFERNFSERSEVGAATAIWVEGELVVNLWGGSADAAGTTPWRENTLAPIYSGTKGLTSTCVHLLVDRGELDLDAPVTAYWPEFGQAGKADVTVRQLLGPCGASRQQANARSESRTHRECHHKFQHTTGCRRRPNRRQAQKM